VSDFEIIVFVAVLMICIVGVDVLVRWWKQNEWRRRHCRKNGA